MRSAGLPEAGLEIAADHPRGTEDLDASDTDSSRQTVNTDGLSDVFQVGASLRSLGSAFRPLQHGSYLARLEEAVNLPGTKNVAIAGRYGTGKSSVLDEFTRVHSLNTLRLAISSLGPRDSDDSVTNQIQKEIVKQLIYSAKPGSLRHSRFRRLAPISKTKAAVEATGLVASVAVICAILGWYPDLGPVVAARSVQERTAAYLITLLMVALLLAAARLITHNRFSISDFSAAGASIKLTERNSTYFDEYLDEIVQYFDNEPIKYVILEDLDRFDEPRIFEVLRELNSLLNKTFSRRASGIPLIFIYAVRDSLFEATLPPVATAGVAFDPVDLELVRANRTKFFDVVIPMVPFVSHRNARELLLSLMEELGDSILSRRLLAVVAQHVSDMRLMINIRNEFLIFADSLLGPEKAAPGLTADGLFALVAYKNVHLKDFEALAHRRSNLDKLYRLHQEFVERNIATLQAEERDLINGDIRWREQVDRASQAGDALIAFAETLRSVYGQAGRVNFRFELNGRNFDGDAVKGPEFWSVLAKSHSVGLIALSSAYSTQALGSINREQLAAVVPGALDAKFWETTDDDDVQTEMRRIRGEIQFLRSAGFAQLANAPSYVLASSSGENETSRREWAFADVVMQTIESDLGRDLLLGGYIDRNFAVYAAQFYGNFTGLDVATFIIQNVQQNVMAFNYQFSSDVAIENLLEEAGEELFEGVSCYNLFIVDYLLERDDDRIELVVRSLLDGLADPANDANHFLSAYFTSGARRADMAGRLAKSGWTNGLDYVVADDRVPENIRAMLASEVIDAGNVEEFESSDRIVDFIGKNYPKIDIFTHGDKEQARHVVKVVGDLNLLMPDMQPLSDPVRVLIIEQGLFTLNAVNVRLAALGNLPERDPISLDRLMRIDPLTQRILSEPAAYLLSVQGDSRTVFAIEKRETLGWLLGEALRLGWSKDLVDQFLNSTNPAAQIHDLQSVPQEYLGALTRRSLVEPTVKNLAHLIDNSGEVGTPELAGLLRRAGDVAVSDVSREDDQERLLEQVALWILNNSLVGSLEQRIKLVRRMGLSFYLDPDLIQVQNGEARIIGELIRQRVVEDGEASMRRARGAGWPSLRHALENSSSATTSLGSAWIEGHVVDVMSDPALSNKLGNMIVRRLEEFTSGDDGAVVRACARFAADREMFVSIEVVRLFAMSGASDQDVLDSLGRVIPTPTPDEVLAVFALMGEPMSGLVDGSVTEIELHDDGAQFELARILADTGQWSFSKKKNKPGVVLRRTTKG